MTMTDTNLDNSAIPESRDDVHAVPEVLCVALDDARVAVTHLLAAGTSDRQVALDERDLSDAFDSDHGLDGFEVDRHHAESLIRSARTRMRAIHAAYERMADGTYGTCVDCGVGIDHQRLMAVPETSWCIECAAPPAQAVAVLDFNRA